MKRILTLLMAVSLLLCLAACGQPADHAPEQPPQQAEPSEPPDQTEPPALEGEALLISAMTGMPSAFFNHRRASIGAGAWATCRFNSSSDTLFSRACWSSTAPATNSSSTDMAFLSVIYSIGKLLGFYNWRSCEAICTASTLASALLRVSCHSLAGTESSTIPAPACTLAS